MQTCMTPATRGLNHVLCCNVRARRNTRRFVIAFIIWLYWKPGVLAFVCYCTVRVCIWVARDFIFQQLLVVTEESSSSPVAGDSSSEQTQNIIVSSMTETIVVSEEKEIPSWEHDQRIISSATATTTLRHPLSCRPNEASCNARKMLKSLETLSLSSSSFSSSSSSSSDAESPLNPLRTEIRRFYSYLKSTEENWQSDGKEFYGPYAEIRASLDYTYHSNYKRERQALQVSKVFCFGIIY